MKVNLWDFLAVVLTIIFVIAKLTGMFLYSWWWVFSPLLIYAGIVAVIWIIALLIVFLTR